MMHWKGLYCQHGVIYKHNAYGSIININCSTYYHLTTIFSNFKFSTKFSTWSFYMISNALHDWVVWCRFAQSDLVPEFQFHGSVIRTTFKMIGALPSIWRGGGLAAPRAHTPWWNGWLHLLCRARLDGQLSWLLPCSTPGLGSLTDAKINKHLNFASNSGSTTVSTTAMITTTTSWTS